MSVTDEQAEPKKAALVAPLIGFLNLLGDRGEALLEVDSKVLAPLFRASFTSSKALPPCDVLFLYCHIEESGRIAGAAETPSNIVKACGARVGVVVAENCLPGITQCVKTRGDWPADLIFIANRNGVRFGQFFHALFRDMWNGIPLAQAWAKLAPQGPAGKAGAADVPGGFFVAGIPHLVFARDWFPTNRLPSEAEIKPVADEIFALLRYDYEREVTRRGLARLLGKKWQLDAPSFFSALGALLGFSVHQSIVKGGYLNEVIIRTYKGLLVTVTGKDRQTYLLGNLVNWLLFEATPGRLPAYLPILNVLRHERAAPPDLIKITKHVAATVGSETFGIPNLPRDQMPAEMPSVALRRLWPNIQAIMERHARPPRAWPIDMGCVVAQALRIAPSFPKTIAAGIVMEAAIPMSKIWTQALEIDPGEQLLRL